MRFGIGFGATNNGAFSSSSSILFIGFSRFGFMPIGEKQNILIGVILDPVLAVFKF